jgi:hypothetical protein
MLPFKGAEIGGQLKGLEEAANKQKKSVYTSPGHPIKFIL